MIQLYSKYLIRVKSTEYFVTINYTNRLGQKFTAAPSNGCVKIIDAIKVNLEMEARLQLIIVGRNGI